MLYSHFANSESDAVIPKGNQDHGGKDIALNA